MLLLNDCGDGVLFFWQVVVEDADRDVSGGDYDDSWKETLLRDCREHVWV